MSSYTNKFFSAIRKFIAVTAYCTFLGIVIGGVVLWIVELLGY